MSKRLPLDLKKEITAAVAEDQKVWEHDRSLTVGASEVFGCHRRCFFKKRQPELADDPEELDDVEWGTAERGNVIEDKFAVPKIRAIIGDDVCKFMGDDQKTLVHKTVPLSATPDGLLLDQPRDFLSNYGKKDLGSDSNEIAVEIKTFDPRSADLTDKPRPRHEGQCIVQQGLFRDTTNYQPATGIIIYFNPSNLKDIRPFVVDYDPHVYQRAQDRAAMVYDLTKSAKDFRAEGKRTNQCPYCEFTEVCHKIEMEMYPEQDVKLKDIDPLQLKELEGLARSVAADRKLIKTVTEREREATEELRMLLFEVGTTKAGDMKKLGWRASVSKQAGRKGLDKDKIAEEFDIDLNDYQTQGPDYFVTRVKADEPGTKQDDDGGAPESPSGGETG